MNYRLIKNYLHLASRLLPDKLHCDLMYYLHFHKFINWENPQTFNEKLNWLKLYDRKPEYTIYVDKYKVRDYIAKTIGEEYLIPLLGVWDKPEEIDFKKLPNQFVLKTNHDSQGVIICKDKKKFNENAAVNFLHYHLKMNGYWYAREWAYKNVPRKIIAEKYMVDESGYELKDYKVMCFNGKAKYIRVYFNRDTDLRINWYDLDWNFCDIRMVEPPDRSIRHHKPERLKEMIELSEKISRNIAFARVDWYIVNNKLYAGEITLYPDGGIGDFEPRKYDKLIGNLLLLPNKE